MSLQPFTEVHPSMLGCLLAWHALLAASCHTRTHNASRACIC